MRGFALALLISAACCGCAQEEHPAPFTDPVALLKAVADIYSARAETFHMEAVKETVQNNDLQRSWTKVYLKAIKGPGSVYRIETRSPWGSYIEDSDGTHEWVYLIEAHAILERPTPPNGPTMPKIYVAENSEIASAWRMRQELEQQAAQYKHAAMLRSEVLDLDGHRFDCYVVHVTSEDSDLEHKDAQWNETFWIDKQALVFRKIVQHIDGYIIVTAALRTPFVQDITTTYPVAEFNTVADPATFAFTPPADAKRVASLEPQITLPESKPKADMVGRAAPNAIFPTPDGKGVPLSSLRGQPVLIDLWATWCGPCMASMPSLARLYSDVKDRMTFITVDQDEVADAPASYLARHGYTWTNFHDPMNKVGQAFKSDGIPLTVLIDAQGKIVYFDFGGHDRELRDAIASLGPEFNSVAAPRAKQTAAEPEPKPK